MKVLISAFSCCPGAGSEPGIGWNWLMQAAKNHDVWLLTSDEYREKVEPTLPANVRATFIPSYHRWSKLKRTGIPGLDWLYYYFWQWKAYRIGRRLHASTQFDLVHHVTFASWRAPSFLCLLPVPFIWGPVSGGETFPWKLRGEISFKGRLFEVFREICQHISRWDPFIRLTMRRSRVIMASNPDTLRIIPEAYHSKVAAVTSSNGISLSEMAVAVPPSQPRLGFLVLFVGLLEHRKAASLAIRAFQKLVASRPDSTLVLIGRGPERDRLQLLADHLGVSERVKFLGGLSRAEVLGWMETADVFLFPSLRDSGGFVLLEAMLASKPIVCLDLGGPGYFVTEDCGIRVPVGTREEVINGLSSALLALLRIRFSVAGWGRKHVSMSSKTSTGTRKGER